MNFVSRREWYAYAGFIASEFFFIFLHFLIRAGLEMVIICVCCWTHIKNYTDFPFVFVLLPIIQYVLQLFILFFFSSTSARSKTVLHVKSSIRMHLVNTYTVRSQMFDLRKNVNFIPFALPSFDEIAQYSLNIKIFKQNEVRWATFFCWVFPRFAWITNERVNSEHWFDMNFMQIIANKFFGFWLSDLNDALILMFADATAKQWMKSWEH